MICFHTLTEYKIQNKTTQNQLTEMRKNNENSGFWYFLQLIGNFFLRIFTRGNNQNETNRSEMHSQMFQNHQIGVKFTTENPKEKFAKVHCLETYFKQICDVAGKAKNCIDNQQVV